MASTEAARRKKRNARERERRRLVRLHRYEERAPAPRLPPGRRDRRGRPRSAGRSRRRRRASSLDGPLYLKGLNDSKQVRPELRAELAARSRRAASGWAVGEASVAEIDRLNIYWAIGPGHGARHRRAAGCAIDYLLTDAVRIKSFVGPARAGDQGRREVRHGRGRLDRRQGPPRRAAGRAGRDSTRSTAFAEHKGYATQQHIEALTAHGPCAAHRRGFWRVRAAWDALPGMEQFVAEERALEEASVPT